MCRDGPPCWGHLAALCPSQCPGKPTVSLLPCPTDTRGHLLPLGCVWVSSYKPPLCVPPFLVLEQETPAHFRAGSSFPPGAFGVAPQSVPTSVRKSINPKCGFSFAPKSVRPRVFGPGQFQKAVGFLTSFVWESHLMLLHQILVPLCDAHSPLSIPTEPAQLRFLSRGPTAFFASSTLPAPPCPFSEVA